MSESKQADLEKAVKDAFSYVKRFLDEQDPQVAAGVAELTDDRYKMRERHQVVTVYFEIPNSDYKAIAVKDAIERRLNDETQLKGRFSDLAADKVTLVYHAGEGVGEGMALGISILRDNIQEPYRLLLNFWGQVITKKGVEDKYQGLIKRILSIVSEEGRKYQNQLNT